VTALLEPGVEPPALEELEDGSLAARRRRARELLGIGLDPGQAAAERQQVPPLRQVLRTADVSLYPVGALGLLGVVDTFQAYGFTVLAPDISYTLGLSLGAIGLARGVAAIATAVAPLPVAALSQRRGIRAVLCLVTALVWSVLTLFTGFTLSLAALFFLLLFDGLSTGSVAALHPPLIADSYPPQARMRMFTTYTQVTTAGLVVAPLFVALLSGPLGLTWRGVFLAMGVTSLLATLAALGLRDPGVGHFDTEVIRASAEDDGSPFAGLPTAPAALRSAADAEVELGFVEIVRRLLLIPTVQRLCAGFLVFGILVIPYATFLSSFLEQRWGLDAAERGLFFAFTNAVAVAVLQLFGRYAEGLFRSTPARVLDVMGTVLVAAVLAVAAGALMPVFGLMVAFFAVGASLVALVYPGLNAVLLSIVDGDQRAHAAALIGLFTGIGSLVGAVLLGQVDAEYGLTGTIISLLVPGIAGGLLIRSSRHTVDRDLDAMITTILESEDIATLTASGGRLPMLSTRGVDFSYGQLQVLFDVDFTVDDGEMVALLGTNGAGKSTLLKVVSGIGLPQSGTVRFRGRDITYLDAERRLRLGITQVPGGRAVFGPMDVMENLRAFGYAAPGSKRSVEEAIERCLETFPRLRERRTSLASTLSGGEQQMLGLSKALILRPQLLLIDELSLGLAPIIVGQLLDMVRAINAEGTAVVLVEQSVNIALSLVDHAYFMEKGQMRFDGPAQELLGRDDLLRAVFLDGATSGVATAGSALTGAARRGVR